MALEGDKNQSLSLQVLFKVPSSHQERKHVGVTLALVLDMVYIRAQLCPATDLNCRVFSQADGTCSLDVLAQ